MFGSTAFVFEVDKSLVPEGKSMDSEFRIWFASFCASNNVFLVDSKDNADSLVSPLVTSMVNSVYTPGVDDAKQFADYDGYDNLVYFGTEPCPGVQLHKGVILHEENDWSYTEKLLKTEYLMERALH